MNHPEVAWKLNFVGKEWVLVEDKKTVKIMVIV